MWSKGISPLGSPDPQRLPLLPHQPRVQKASEWSGFLCGSAVTGSTEKEDVTPRGCQLPLLQYFESRKHSGIFIMKGRFRVWLRGFLPTWRTYGHRAVLGTVYSTYNCSQRPKGHSRHLSFACVSRINALPPAPSVRGLRLEGLLGSAGCQVSAQERTGACEPGLRQALDAHFLRTFHSRRVPGCASPTPW